MNDASYRVSHKRRPISKIFLFDIFNYFTFLIISGLGIFSILRNGRLFLGTLYMNKHAFSSCTRLLFCCLTRFETCIIVKLCSASSLNLRHLSSFIIPNIFFSLCKCPIDPYVRLLGWLSVGPSFGRSVFHNFLKRQESYTSMSLLEYELVAFYHIKEFF